mgnify:CR=1 FL=1
MKLKYNVKSKSLCANCAGKIEEALKKIDGINDANLSFLTETLKLNVDDDKNADLILEEANKIADTIEPGTVFLAK